MGFTYNGQLGTIDVSGYHISQSRKYRNIIHNAKVAFVVDDIPSRAPWRVHCLEVRGTAARGVTCHTWGIKSPTFQPPTVSTCSSSSSPKWTF
ncbi:pyridoxamine 5'-phosphate oxidase-related FMN-binding protein [Mycobacteroides abscessus subsp. abscessus]|nr:pyridoxamine 5'-phosphate oxidase-related FMN-binding protein [Mycobacteroides abscessus subsp. abscessus]